MTGAARWVAVGAALATACSTGTGQPAPAASPSPRTPTASSTASSAPSPASSPSRTTTAQPSPRPTHSPTSTPTVVPAVLLRRLTTTRHVVALTFDAGSDTGRAAEVLDLLAGRGVHASFGVTGAWVRANPTLARRIAAEGHLLVNHTDRHVSFTGFSSGTTPLTREQRWDALAAAEASIRSYAGVTSKPWFRPPYGDRDAGVDRDVAAVGYRYELLWTVDTLGWKGVPPEQVVSRTMAALEPGEIVLLHVGQASTDADALPVLLDRLADAGYACVRADGVS